MSKMKWLIIIISIIIVILFAIIMLLPKSKQGEPNSINNNTSVEESEDVIESLEDTRIDDSFGINEEPGYMEYFTITNCISQYLDTINSNNSKYYSRDNENRVSQDEINEIIRALLSDNYESDIQMLEEKNMFIPIKILRKTKGVTKSYAVYGITANTDMEYQKDVYYIVNLDDKNSTYSIEPLDDINNLDELIDIKIDETESIEKNEYNTFSYQQIDEQYNCQKVFEHMKKLMLVKPELAYEYLSDDYKSKRYGSYERFIQYIDDNRKHLIGITPTRYSTEVENNNVIWYVMDQYSVWYKFNIKNTMTYTAQLEDYIILGKKETKEYNKYKAVEKVKYNINRWIKMLNSRDYEIAYDYLDETFRENNYDSVEEFAEFMSSKYPDWYNEVDIKVEENGNTYTAEVELDVEDEEFTDKYMTVIMQLGDDTNFTMSFNAE